MSTEENKVPEVSKENVELAEKFKEEANDYFKSA